MFQLAETPNRLVNFILHPRNYTLLYNRLTTLLGPGTAFVFARPELHAEYTNWKSEIPGAFSANDARTFDQLKDEEKDTVSDTFERLKAEIGARLENEPEFKAIWKELFLIPSSRDIRVIYKDGRLMPILTQWGCRSNETTSQIDPLTTIINRPRTTTAPVRVEIFYTDGTKATEKSFYISYLGAETLETTNKDGLYDRGRCLLNSTFSVYDLVNGKESYTQNFTVTPEASYIVRFPRISSGTLKVLDHKDNTLTDIPVIVTYKGTDTEYNTGSAGVVDLPGLEVGQSISFREKGHPGSARMGTSSTGTASTAPTTASSTTASSPAATAAAGTASAPNTPSASASNTPSASISYIVEVEENEFFLKQPPPPEEQKTPLKPEALPQLVTIRLLDEQNKPMPSIPMDLTTNGKTKNELTGQAGTFTVSQSWFTDRKKVQATIYLPNTSTNPSKKSAASQQSTRTSSPGSATRQTTASPSSGAKKPSKIIRKSFTYKKENSEYTLKLRKKNRWWWLLLLLLLPLLLLIRFEKNVYVRAFDAEANTRLPNTEVHFSYQKAFLYDSGRFCTNDTVNLHGQTDQQGIVGFMKLKYSLYSYIFKGFSKASVFGTNHCYVSDTLSPFFHRLSEGDTLSLPMHPVFTSLDFKVVDKDDRQPLPEAKVELKTTLAGKEYIDTATTAADGRVVFKHIPVCGRLVKIIANLEGYYPDSITNKNLDELAGNIDTKRLLALTPIKKPIEFFVVDCRTREPIPNATVTIDFLYQNKNTSRTVKTNVNGIGKGYYPDAHIIAKIHLTAEKIYYKKGELPGIHLVKDFLLYPPEKRTICLEPEPNPVAFIDVDARTGKPLAGVTNTVTIRNGGSTTTQTLISNGNGQFVVAGVIIGDKLSILAQYPPDYEDNNTTIRDADGIALMNGPVSDRTIPLTPKETDLLFRTLDAATGALVPDADLQVTVDGSPLSDPVKSGSGEFTVHVPVTAIISIAASKQPKYGLNNQSVYNKAVKGLMTAPQSERDIPLPVNTPPPPCSEPPQEAKPTAGGSPVVERHIDMKNPGQEFYIDYNMYKEPDQIQVYCGIGTGGTLLAGTQEQVKGTGRLTINMKDCGQTTWITVVITGTNSATDRWDYQFVCPPSQ